ncbi:MAG: alpha/beta hydrolase family protein [Candidatus Latescibacteria bacterium]|nr:alpha/beta hydrolase family protein [Candidatus Latescibacterota bacterium]
MNRAYPFSEFLAEYAQSARPSLPYDGEDLDAWRAAFRNALADLRGPEIARVPLKVHVDDVVKEEDHVRERVYFDSVVGVRVAADMLVPLGLEPGEKRPALLCLHGHTSDGRSNVTGTSDSTPKSEAYALDFVRAGFVTITPDWLGWGERVEDEGVIGDGRDKCNVAFVAGQMWGVDLLSLMISDGEATLDYLMTRDEVDHDRIGCVGLSFGGRMTMYLAAMDHRIKTAVTAGCLNLFEERSLKMKSCGAQFFPGILRYGDVGEVLALIAPKPSCHVYGTADPLLNTEDVAQIRSILEDVYTRMGCSDALGFVEHDGAHVFPTDLAVRWLLDALTMAKE